ncbi:MAG: DUF4197 domain-containing protein [Sedimenticolaceae bacterium]
MKFRLSTRLLLTALSLSIGVAYAGFGDMFKSAGDLIKQAPGVSGSGAASSLSDSQITAGLKDALSVGARRAVELLGKQGGFLDDPSVRIPLPGVLGSAAKGLRAAGQGEYVDAFETTVNRAAEEAVPQTLDIVENTVRNMSLDDVRGILSGGDDAATQYLRKHAGPQLRKAILPIVSRATDSAGATSAYKALKTEADGLLGGFGGLGGLVDKGSLDLDKYVTDETLDGLFVKLAAEEKAIRENPAARTTDILKTVFGK